MKNYKILVAAILLCFNISYSQSGWEQQTVSPLRTLRSIKVFSSNTGYAVGDSGAVFKTTNGGVNWLYSRPDNSSNFASAFFINESTGWICGAQYFSAATLMKTTNGGQNWFYQSSQISTTLRSVFFLDSLNGWIVGSSIGLVSKTTNGGINWSINFRYDNYPLLDVYFIDNQTGWVGGTYAIFKTTNGGTNWNNQISSNDVVYGFSFINSQTGWAGAHNYVLKTTNGGGAWVRGAQISNFDAIFDVKFLNQFTGYGILDEGYIMKTTNGGANWGIGQFQTIFYGLDFLNIDTGYVVGRWGRIHKTVTGGATLISHISTEIPEKFSLYQNYPNPFNPTTNIKFDIHKQGIATLKVFDLLGKEMETLVDEQLSVGTYEVAFNASSLPSGIYFYVLKTGDFVESKKMVLVK